MTQAFVMIGGIIEIDLYWEVRLGVDGISSRKNGTPIRITSIYANNVPGATTCIVTINTTRYFVFGLFFTAGQQHEAYST